MDHPNQALIRRFYAAFAALDAEAMQACYAPDARFEDEAFTLNGAEEIGAMWRMLCEGARERGRDVWRLESSGIVADAAHGRAHWEAHYRFGPGGRVVHNVVEASFVFRDGRIAHHRDRFDFWRWARQALGPAGLLLGWTPWLRGQVRRQASARLAAWRRRGARAA
jgi:ketosteroid isomerase-like protein